ncbi:MAG: 50S ribosomal protein L15 [Prosthecobacter sp.]|jgi:large subunit ribosomal protein L15|nr:50S ribosomal protein L15 [Prosthecobacter sp.]
MRLHETQPRPGARKRKKRIGCGESSGHGKTSCKGHKGQMARAGRGIRPGFEGGQMPLFRRLPKKGFSNDRFRDVYETVNVGDLNAFEDGAVINEASLREKGLVNRVCDAIKILGNGELSRRLTVEIKSLSAAAREKIEKAGGTIAA